MKNNNLNYLKFFRIFLVFILFFVGLFFYLFWGSSLFNIWLTPILISIQLIFSWLYIKKNKIIWLLPIFGMALFHYFICFIILPKYFKPTSCDFFKMETTLCDCRGIKVFNLNKTAGSDCYGNNRGLLYTTEPGKSFLDLKLRNHNNILIGE